MSLMRACVSALLTALLSGAAFGQSPETTPKFEVADVHSSPRTTQLVARGPFYDSGRYELRFATMVDLIRVAYDVDPEKVYGGPNWLEMDRFDVFAKVPPGSSAASRRLMLKALLAERFKLVAHQDSKPMAAFALTAGKHPQLKEADGSGESGCNFSVQNGGPPQGGGQGGQPSVIQLPVISYTCRNTSMEAFAAGLLSMAGTGQYFNNKPVVDQTDLKGNWDFVFRYTPKVPAGIPTTGESIPLFDAIEKQLGLKLEASTVPLTVVVVDSVNQKPTENSAEALKAFPPLPTEFDVAEIKPSTAAPAGGRGGDGPRPEITLRALISVAWDITSDEMMPGAPKWLNDDRFDVIAKAPSGVAVGDLTPTRTSIPVNIDALRPMIRSLVVDRFKLVTHTEERPVTTYVLTATKPKLKAADPASRTKWQEGAAPDAKNSKNANPSLGRLVTCQNLTMAQFAALIPSIAPGYVRTEVVDSTGLEGGWDFTFSFSPAGALQLGGGGRRGEGGDGAGPPSGGTIEASDPTGALSLFDALSKQLGLKLEAQKRPMPVLIIDHIERKPTDN